MIFSDRHPPEGTVRDWLDHRAEAEGERISHLFPAGEAALTWRDLRDEAAKTARHLAGLGAARGESVALMVPNGRDAVIALFGVLYGGFRATLINLVAGQEAIGYALRHCRARIILQADDARGLTDPPAGALVVRVAGGVHWPAPTTAPLEDIGPFDDALLMYTSGTTGQPKGVVHTHASLLAGGWTTACAHGLGPKDRGFCVLPVYHINGLCVTLMGPLVSGGSVAMVPRFSARRFWSDAAGARVTWFSVVPTIVSHLLHGDAEPDPETRTRIRFGRSASSALSEAVHTAFEDRFGVPLIETMGLTETAAQILSNPLPPAPRRIGSPGRAVGCEVAIIDGARQPVGPGVTGEIAVRGPNVMRGYLDNPEATGETFADDWLCTGDLGYMDETGFVVVTGRLKELIIKGGENIAPREIDDALYAHADVIEAAAFARPCAHYGERVEAAVRLRPDAQTDGAALRRHCAIRVGEFKAPDTVHVLPELPKGPSGKIQRLKLADMTRTKSSN